MDNLESIFESFILDANEGICFDDVNIRFHTLDKTSLTGTFNDVPILIIKNKKELINKLKTYVEIVLKHEDIPKTKSNIRKVIISLFSNACYEDFSNPNLFIDSRINFYINDDFLNTSIKDNDVVIKRNVEPMSKKTPYAFRAYIEGEEKHYLPRINYGISNDICYIYDITMPVNKKEYKTNDTLLSLALFFKELYKHGIGKVKVVSCMPMRSKNSEILDNFIDISYLFSNIVISSLPFEVDEYMNINISAYDDKSNKILLNLFDKE